MSLSGFLLLLLVQVMRPAPVPGMPAAPGVYCRQGDGQWIKIEPAATADTKAKGMGIFLYTNGLYNPDMTVVFVGARAPVQISTPRPTLYARGVGSAKDAMIVQLTRKKDSRTLQTSSSAAGVDNKGGFKKKDIRNVTVIVYSDDSYSVTPDADMKPGEYLLLLGLANASFDFGISPAKKFQQSGQESQSVSF